MYMCILLHYWANKMVLMTMQEKLQREEEELKREKERLIDEREAQRLQRYVSASIGSSSRPAALTDVSRFPQSAAVSEDRVSDRCRTTKLRPTLYTAKNMFYLHDTMLARVLAMALCLSVRHKSELY